MSVFNFISGLAISLKKEQELMFKDLDIELIIYMIHEERCSLRVLYTFQKSSSKSIQSLNFFFTVYTRLFILQLFVILTYTFFASMSQLCGRLIKKGILASEQYDND